MPEAVLNGHAGVVAAMCGLLTLRGHRGCWRNEAVVQWHHFVCAKHIRRGVFLA